MWELIRWRLAWAVVAFMGFAWGYHEHTMNTQLRVQNGLLRELGSTQLQWYYGTALANRRCAGLLRDVLLRLGLDPEVESLVTTAVLHRHDFTEQPEVKANEPETSSGMGGGEE